MTTHYNSTGRNPSILSNLKLPGTFVAARRVLFPSKTIVNRFFRKLLRELDSTLIVPFRRSYNSNCVGYDKNLETLNKPIRLYGYFQTWRYPKLIRDTIVRALENEVLLSDYAQSLIQQMKLSKILVVHIRLGDYKNSENSYIGVLSPEYYGEILKRPELQQYRVFVFSDDISDAKSSYSLSFPLNATWVDERQVLGPLETLTVMSHGKAFVIANSTFSWWCAFLSQDSETIIAPSKWFKEKEDPEDLIPQNWHREDSQWVN
jgi:hypothetical protein